MRRIGFRKALKQGNPSLEPRDASKLYAELGSAYAWASPSYVRDQMTEPQLYGYLQHLHTMQIDQAKLSASAMISEAIQRILPAFGFKVR